MDVIAGRVWWKFGVCNGRPLSDRKLLKNTSHNESSQKHLTGKFYLLSFVANTNKVHAKLPILHLAFCPPRVACRPPRVIGCLPRVTCRPLRVICCLPRVACRPQRVIGCLLRVAWRPPRVIGCLPRVACRPPPVIGRLLRVAYRPIFLGRSVRFGL